MPVNVFRGDAPARRKILRIGPPPADQLSGRFEIECPPGSGKILARDGWSAAALAAAWNALTIGEFREATASADGDALVLTGPADGTPFDVSIAATGFVSIETDAEGSAPINEVQRVTIPEATGGTFTITFNGQTTAGIAYDATAPTVQAALEALSNIAPGDVAVSGFAGGPWDVEWKGAYAAVEVAEMTVNASGLTGIGGLIDVATTREGSAPVTGSIELWLHDYQAVLGFTGSAATLGVFGQTSAAEVEAFLEEHTGAAWTLTGGYDLGTDTFTPITGTGAEPTANIGDFTLTSPEIPPREFVGTISGTPGRPAIDEIQRVSLTGVNGGTFTLTWQSETTAAIAWNATPAAVKAALEALPSITTVNVNGVAGQEYFVTFVGEGDQDVAEMTADGSLLQAAGTVAEVTAHDPGTNEVQLVILPGSVTGGTFVLAYRGDRTADIAYNASAAAVDAALEGIEAIGAGGVTVDGPAGGPWLVTFTTKAEWDELQADAAGLSVGTGALVTLEQTAGGPTHWNDPLNWTLGRPPESGDSVWLDQPRLDLTHSLRQRTGFTLDSAAKDTLAADGPMHFTAGQKVTLRTTDTLPGGLAPGDYYVADPDEHARTFKLSATRGGSVIDLTSSAGAGTHTALVELDAADGAAVLTAVARFTGPLGLPRRNARGYWEYRPRCLEIGVRSTGTKLVRIGSGDGQGSGLLRLDLGPDAATVKVIQTGGSTESGVPAFLVVGTNVGTDFIQLDGEAGAAAFPGETCVFRSLDVRGGTFFGGEGLTIEGDVTARPGSVRGRYLDAAGNEHRWE